MFLKRNFMMVTLGPLLALALLASYYRFMVSLEYEVTYEGFCDPTESSCFVYCEDEDCAQPIYYTWVSRQASALVAVCGEMDVLSCDAASECTDGEAGCLITYCNPLTATDEEPCDSL